MKNSSKGFTLIEVMIAVSIICILITISIPIYQTYVNKIHITTCHHEAAEFIKQRNIAIILGTPADVIPSYIPTSCLSAINTTATSISESTNNAVFTAKDTNATTVTCVWSTLACNIP